MIKRVRNYLSQYIKVDDPKAFQILEPYEKAWYRHTDRTSKYRLGKLFYDNVRDAERQDIHSRRIAREIDIPRISVFTIEKFENTLVQLFQVPGIERIWLQPTNYYIDE